MSSNAGMNETSCSGASWSFMYAYDFVEPSWSLKVTQGETTSSIDVPPWAIAALRIAESCFLSPENERTTNVAPSWMASAQVSMGGSSFTTPVLSFELTSAVAENCPFVSPYTPLFSMTYTILRLRRIRWTNCPIPIDAVSPSPETPRGSSVRLARAAPVATDG